MAMQHAGLYLHIPFCRQKCLYCDFLSFAKQEGNMAQYAEALCREIVARSDAWQSRTFDSIFIGGGTPSLLDPAQLAMILSHVRQHFHITHDAEISMELNPGTLQPGAAAAYQQMGINRISVGVQSTSNRLLKNIGRIHDFETVVHTLSVLEKHFTNINLDLILGIPGLGAESAQTMEEWLSDLAFIQSVQPNHVSLYSMITEPGTPLHRYTEAGCVQPVDDDSERQMYHQARAFLQAAGYAQYEISNFAKPGAPCLHNIKYWTHAPYLGLGLGSSSFIPEGESFLRTANTTDFWGYLANPAEGLVVQERLSGKMLRNEFMLLGFRMIQGPDPDLYRTLYGGNLLDDYRAEIANLCRHGLIQKNLTVTSKGLDYANEIFRTFLEND